MFFHGNSGYVDAAKYYVYKWIACLCIKLPTHYKVIVSNKKFNIFRANVCGGNSIRAIEG